MSRYYNYKVKLTKFLQNGVYDEFNVITVPNIIDFSTNLGIGSIKDTFDFRVLNSDNKFYETFHNGDGSNKSFVWTYGNIPANWYDKLKVYVDDVRVTNFSISGDTINLYTAPPVGTNNVKIFYPLFEYEDKIEIFQCKNREINEETDLIIGGIINDVNGSSTGTDRRLTISGVGMIEIFFNTLAFAKSYTTEEIGATVPDIIQSVVNQVNGLNINREVNFIKPTTKSDGTAFAVKTYYANYKKALEIIEELSADSYTDDGIYYFYVKYNRSTKKYDLYWKPKKYTDTPKPLVEGTDVFSLKFDLMDDDVVNAIIYNCGIDPNGHGMEFLHLNTSGNTFNGGGGTNWYYMTTTTHIGDDLINNEFEAKPSSWEVTDDGSRVSNFPNSYPYTATFSGRNEQSPYKEDGSAVTVNSDSDWVKAIRLEAKGQGYKEAKVRTDLYSKARRGFKITLPFDEVTSFISGEIVNVTAPSFGIDGINLRILGVNIDKGIMILEVKEDETTVND